jgi:hypothetical protein
MVEVLGGGEQTLILRKGGIHEQGKRFNVAHREFFLFPTFEHQNPEDLKPRGAKILKKVSDEKPEPGILPIRYYAVVEESFWISEEKILQELSPFHFWSWECIKARYEAGEKKGLFGLVVRIHAFPEPTVLQNLKQYGGCRSWVELEKPLPTGSLKAVLTDEAFQERRRELEKILKIRNLQNNNKLS